MPVGDRLALGAREHEGGFVRRSIRLGCEQCLLVDVADDDDGGDAGCFQEAATGG